jgi:phage/plasmid-like protein (TIGR03299 family)
MSHNIEKLASGEYSIAWSGETPWHGLGKKVLADLTPEQMLNEANLDWEVEKVPAYAMIGKKKIAMNHCALVRTSDNRKLAEVTMDWKPIQNAEAFEFFDDFIKAGEMEMHTAGSLQNGQIVWGLAKIKQGFKLFKGDEINGYLLFSNFHKYGFSTDVRFTPVRVVCNNTLTLSLSGKSDRVVKISHRKDFIADEVKETLGVAKEKLAKYKEMASFLGSKKYNKQNVVEYFKELMPNSSKKEDKLGTLSRTAKMGMAILETQPGADYAPGTWWNAFNAATFLVDHTVGRSTDSRLTSAWYGYGRKLKTKALEKAVDYANA